MGLSPTWPGGGGTYPLTFDGTSTPPLHSSRVLPLTDQLSDDATCRLPRCSRLPPSPSSGLFQQQLSPALAWWEPFTPETRPSSPRLRPYFSELKACTTLDANVKALSSDAPSETDPAPFSQSSQLSYVLIPASNLSMGPISTPPPSLPLASPSCSKIHYPTHSPAHAASCPPRPQTLAFKPLEKPHCNLRGYIKPQSCLTAHGNTVLYPLTLALPVFRALYTYSSSFLLNPFPHLHWRVPPAHGCGVLCLL